jgi:hypothetical protein
MNIEEMSLEEVELELQLLDMDDKSDTQSELMQIDAELEQLDALIAGSAIPQETPTGPARAEWAERNALEKATGIASQALGSAEEMVLEGFDLLVAPVRAAGEVLTGQQMRSLPQFAKEEFGIGADYMPEGVDREVVDVAGALAGVAPALAGVARTGASVKDVVLDIAGMGSSVGTQSMRQAQRTAEGLMQSDKVKLFNPETATDHQIQQMANKVGVQLDIAANRPSFELYEQQKAELARKLDKGIIATDMEIVQPVKVSGLRTVVEAMEKIGVSPKRTLDALRRKGGLRFEESMDDLIQLDRQFVDQNGVGKMPNWYDRNFLPVADAVRRYSGQKVGNFFERSVETSVRYGDQLRQRHLKPLSKVMEQVNEDKDLKRLFLDLHRDPKKMTEIRGRIARKHGQDTLKAFDEFINDAKAQNVRAKEKLYKDPDMLNDDYYIHTEKKRSDMNNIWRQLRGSARAKEETKAALRDRSRKPASMMTDEELDQYANPILSHFKHMTEEDQLIRMADEFQLRPSMSGNGSSSQFFDEVREKLMRDGMTDDQSSVGAGLMEQAFLGAKRTPPAYVRAFMSQTYAGTLSQYKSAILNTHDVFVAMYTQGFVNTLKGLKGTIKGEFGKTLDQLGMSGQGTGEFVRNFEQTLDDPTWMDKAAKAMADFTEGAMLVSQFKRMDQYGKGVVLRSAVERMRTAAQKGTLWSDFSDIATEAQLNQIRPYLKEGVKVKDMPLEVAGVIEELAFVALGKQQLISAAGRPLGYLKNPLLRPAYALTGFAIKQQALIRDMVVDAALRGDYASAGKHAARYALYAGLGYGVLNEGRSVVFKNEEPDVDDVALGVFDQMAAAATMNKLGDSYSRQLAAENPVDFLMQSFLPPGGLIEAAAQDVSIIVKNIASDEPAEIPDKTLQKVPALGDFYKYYWKKEEREDAK